MFRAGLTLILAINAFASPSLGQSAEPVDMGSEGSPELGPRDRLVRAGEQLAHHQLLRVVA